MLIPRQIYWLRQLSTASRDEIKVMRKPMSPWVPLYDVIEKYPRKPIHSRSILRNELVLEIDNDSWPVVRDGTRKIIELLEKWNSKNAYYLSFSGNHSIHVHVFIDWSSVTVEPETADVLKSHEDVIATMKRFWTRQFELGTGAVLDMQLTGKHLIRMEGGFNEKSNKYCTMLKSIPDDKPEYYDIVVPETLPLEQWNLSQFNKAINGFLQIHYKPKPVIIPRSGKPFNPEPLIDILKPVYIPGHRHMLVICISGWFKRHGIPEMKAMEIVRALNPNDKTPGKTISTVKNVYKASETDKIPGFHKLMSVIDEEVLQREISPATAETVKNALKEAARPEVVTS